MNLFSPNKSRANSLKLPQISNHTSDFKQQKKKRKHYQRLPRGLFFRPSPRLLCTAMKQKNNGQSLEDTGQNERKADPAATEKVLLDEKVKLEEQLKETVVRPPAALWEGESADPQRGSLGDVWPASRLTDNRSRSQTSSVICRTLAGSCRKVLLKKGLEAKRRAALVLS